MDTSVLVLEDDSFIRMALVETLTLHHIKVVANTDSAAEAIAAQDKFRPKVALLDLDLGLGPTGLDVARVMRRVDPGIGIVFLTSFTDPRFVASSDQKLPAGSQYVVKKSVKSHDTILKAISQSLDTNKVTKWGPSATAEFGKLTDGQVITLRLVAEGFTNQEIARKSGITEKSVEQQIGRIAKRLGIERDLDRNVRVSIASAYFRQASS